MALRREEDGFVDGLGTLPLHPLSPTLRDAQETAGQGEVPNLPPLGVEVTKPTTIGTTHHLEVQ